MLTLELLEKMLLNASDELKAHSKYLCELDSVAGDGDHGVTIARMADAMKAKIEAGKAADIKELLEDLSFTFMGSNGGSAGPLWGTVFEGLAEAVPEGAAEVDAAVFKQMCVAAHENFADISKAKPGDKTMVDALYPALTAGQNADGDLKTVITAMAQAAETGAKQTAQLAAKFGRAKNVGERSIGTPDPGAVSMAILFGAMARALAE